MPSQPTPEDRIYQYRKEIQRYEEEIEGCRERGERDLVEQLVASVLEAYDKLIDEYRELGQYAEVERQQDKVVVHKRQLKKDMEEIKGHPSLTFGPIAQTIAIMSGLSLVMSVVPLPLEVMPFYYLFSRLSMIAVVCLVCHASIIWYGYNQALAKMPKNGESASEKLRKMTKAPPDRPDAWAHTRSHPSAFLSSKHAPPRIFPFPLGKTRPEATVKDELWWEGGNAPHVGHFNKPKIAEPSSPDPEVLWARVRENMEREKQEKLWKKRIRTIQYLCVVIVVAFVNSKVSIAGLCYLIYSTITTELEDMLKPPPDMDAYHRYIDAMARGARNQSAPKPGKDQPVGGMSYIYDPTEARTLKPINTAVPINVVPPYVLMTSENHYYAGPGEQIKDPNK